MKKLFISLLLLFPLILMAAPPAAIKNIDPKSTQISKQEAYWIYSFKTRYWSDGGRITVFLLDFDNPLHISFVKDTLGVNPIVFRQNVESYTNLGLASYRTVSSEFEMFRMVSKIPGSVGYVSDRLLIINSGDNYVRQITITD